MVDPASPYPEEQQRLVAALDALMAQGCRVAALFLTHHHSDHCGGVNALRLAVTNPERVSHLITMGAPANRNPKLFGAGDGPSEGLKILIEAYRTPTAEAMRRLVEIMCFDKRFANEDLCRARSEAASAQPEHLKNFLAGLPKGSPVPQMATLEQMMGISAPTSARPSGVRPRVLRQAPSTSKPRVKRLVVTPQSVSMKQFSVNWANWKIALWCAAPTKGLSVWCTSWKVRTPFW